MSKGTHAVWIVLCLAANGRRSWQGFVTKKAAAEFVRAAGTNAILTPFKLFVPDL